MWLLHTVDIQPNKRWFSLAALAFKQQARFLG
jgi:hypothetical protein